jgi:ATP-dependent Lon protease
VLPVGGIKEKVLAARRAKIDTVILPSLNTRDLEDVNETIRKEMRFVFVDDIKSVFKAALLENTRPSRPLRGTRRLRKSVEAAV